MTLSPIWKVRTGFSVWFLESRDALARGVAYAQSLFVASLFVSREFRAIVLRRQRVCWEEAEAEKGRLGPVLRGHIPVCRALLGAWFARMCGRPIE